LNRVDEKSLRLRRGKNDLSFSVTSSFAGKATCTAHMYYWQHNIPVVISDIDGTITKYTPQSPTPSPPFLPPNTAAIAAIDFWMCLTGRSDVVGHIYTMIGRDWTHQGVAKLFTDITNNGYNLLYLTSRSVGQADTTRGYLKSIVQEKYTIPEGPVIMSPDRTFTALRRYPLPS
jgi:phosphatidate phosphatase LPIN